MDFSLVEKHPVAIGAVVVIGGAALYLYWRSGSTASTGTTVATAAPNTALQQQAIATAGAIQNAQAQTIAQANASQFQLAQNQQNIDGTIALAKISANATTTQQANAITGSTNIASIQADVQKTGISTQAKIASENINANLVSQSMANKLAVTQSTIQQATDMRALQVGYDTATAVANAQDNTIMVLSGNQKDVQLAQLKNQSQFISGQIATQQNVADLLKAGALGNGNRAAVATALLGQGGASQAIANASVASSPAAVIASVGGAAKNILGSLFG